MMSDSFYFPVFSGVLTPKHVDQIGPALWEFLWLVAKTTKEITEDNETIGIVLGGRPIKNLEIANELGNSLRATERNISRLRKHGYIITKRTPYGNIFKVRNSKKFLKNRTAKSDGTKKGDPPNMDREPPNLVERTAESGGNKEDIKDIKDINNIYVEIIDYLNLKTGKRFSPKSAANQKLINGRISEGRTIEDLKHVIDVKTEEWLNNDEMNKFLRPSTLFRPTNFENYLNQKSKTPKEQSDPRDKEIELQQWIADGNDPDDFNWNN